MPRLIDLYMAAVQAAALASAHEDVRGAPAPRERYYVLAALFLPHTATDADIRRCALMARHLSA